MAGPAEGSPTGRAPRGSVDHDGAWLVAWLRAMADQRAQAEDVLAGTRGEKGSLTRWHSAVDALLSGDDWR